jgi:ribosome-associated protein
MGKEAFDTAMDNDPRSDSQEQSEEFKLYPSDVYFEYSGSSGPGGQNVNKTETRVTAVFNIDACPRLSLGQKERIKAQVQPSYLAEGAVLRVSSQHTRSQKQNKEDAVEKMAALIAGALEVPKERKETRVPRSEREARLSEKKHRGQTKKTRGKVDQHYDD